MKRSELIKEIEKTIVEILSEETIDIPGDPSKLTSRQKQEFIKRAQTSTRNPKLGTPENPVDFV